jgi:hypothetical protein
MVGAANGRAARIASRGVVGHQRDIEGLGRGVVAGAPHGNARAHARHGRRIVDVVANQQRLDSRHLAWVVFEPQASKAAFIDGAAMARSKNLRS